MIYEKSKLLFCQIIRFIGGQIVSTMEIGHYRADETFSTSQRAKYIHTPPQKAIYRPTLILFVLHFR